MDNKEQILKEILVKAANFCVYQERTQAEMRERLKEWQIFGDDAEELIAYLISENYINEERFAKVFAGSKFRVKKWGKKKIRYELKARRLTEYCIKAGLAEIDEDDYYETLKELLAKKQHEFRNEKNPLLIKQKLARFAIGKGYESDLIWQAIGDLTHI